jgi:porin
MGRNDADKKLLPHDLRNAFRKAISRVSNVKIAVRPSSFQCWAIKRSTFLGIILSLIFAIPASPQANGPSALAAGSAATAPDSSVVAFESSQRRYLLGDWGGKRTSLAEKGVTFDFFYISDLQANPTGGRQQTQAGWERARGTIDINFDRFIKWQGFSFHATGLWQSGVDLGTKIGTLANPSDLVSAHTTRLDSFWLQQLFLNKKLRVRAGQLAGLDFYGNQEYGGSWLIEPMGYAFGNLFSSVYESFNPAGTPGAEVRFAPIRTFYIKSAVMSGNRDPYKQDPTGFHFQIRDTPDFLFEAGYLVHPSDGNGVQSARSVTGKSYPGVYKFGGVYNGGKFPDPTGRLSSGNYLIYGMASQAVFRSDAGSNRGLDATFGFDWSPGEVTRENSQITAGVRFNAPFLTRKSDRVACALVYSSISYPFRNFGTLLGSPPLGSEKAVELNYSLQVTRYFLLQPTFQYYLNVGGNLALSNAPVLGFRTKVTF